MACEKVKLTKKEAEELLRYIQKCGRQYRGEKRIYYCEACNAWHTTSQRVYQQKQRSVKLFFKTKWNQFINK